MGVAPIEGTNENIVELTNDAAESVDWVDAGYVSPVKN